MEYHDVLTEKVPAWYSLGITDDLSLSISIHPRAEHFIQHFITPTSPIVGSLAKEFNFPPFVFGSHQFGYGGLLNRNQVDEDGWGVWSVHTPNPKEKGTIDWKRLRAISGTLNILCTGLVCFDEPYESGYPQLVVVDHIATEERIYGGALSVLLSKVFINWLSSHEGDIRFVRVEEAMRDIHDLITGERSADIGERYRAWMREPQWLHLDIPGNACGLDPESHRPPNCEGYRLSPHNTDNPLQQYVLLCGVASMCDELRKASNKPVE